MSESNIDQRDFVFGLAGLTAGTHALRVLAEQGLLSPEDAATSVGGVRDILKNVPAGTVSAPLLKRVDDMLTGVSAAAAGFTPKTKARPKNV